MATRPFRFALQAIAKDRSSWLDLARQAEDAGFATLQTADHLGSPDPFLPLVAAAAVTTTLRFGPLVINNELHNPVLLARAAATVDLLTDGRLELGIGTGYAEGEHRQANIPIAPPRERVDRLAASVALLASLLGGDGATSDLYGIDAKPLGLPVLQQPHVPLLVGGHGRRLLDLAARHAQIVQFTGLTHGDDGAVMPGGFALDTIRERVAWVRTSAAERLDDIELSALVQVVTCADAGSARAEAATNLGVSTDLVDESPFLLIGSLGQIIDKLERQRAELGISYLTLRGIAASAPIVAALAGR
jgi:probable F420-dependent oxidoreductase